MGDDNLPPVRAAFTDTSSLMISANETANRLVNALEERRHLNASEPQQSNSSLSILGLGIAGPRQSQTDRQRLQTYYGDQINSLEEINRLSRSLDMVLDLGMNQSGLISPEGREAFKKDFFDAKDLIRSEHGGYSLNPDAKAALTHSVTLPRISSDHGM